MRAASLQNWQPFLEDKLLCVLQVSTLLERWSTSSSARGEIAGGSRLSAHFLTFSRSYVEGSRSLKGEARCARVKEEDRRVA